MLSDDQIFYLMLGEPAWRDYQATPIRELQICSLSETGSCRGRRHSRARRSRAARRRSCSIKGRSDDPGDGPSFHSLNRLRGAP